MLLIEHGKNKYQVTFTVQPVSRLSNGRFERTEQIEASIYDARLNLLGWGISIRSQFDKPNDSHGMSKALKRALSDMVWPSSIIMNSKEEKALKGKFKKALNKAIQGEVDWLLQQNTATRY